MMKLVALLLLLPSLAFAQLEYKVEFRGGNSQVVDTLSSVSQLKLLEEDPPQTLVALRRRAEADLPNLIDGLRSLGFYNAKIKLNIDDEYNPVLVVVSVNTGPVYPLASFKLENVGEEEDSPLEAITLNQIGVQLGRPAIPKKILDSESEVLALLALEGYPLACVVQRRVQADQKEKKIYVTLFVDPGKKVVFGPTQIEGLQHIDQGYLMRLVAWKRGDAYDPHLVEKTQSALEGTGLFSAISIQEGDEVVDGNELPMVIQVQEANHRTIGFGVGYNTQLGPGVTVNWEHRNIRQRGEKIRVKGDVWIKKQTGVFEYILPNFCTQNQQLKWVAELEKEITEGFTETFCSFSGVIEKRVNDFFRFSYGLQYKQLYSTRSDNNRPFFLFKFPLTVRWTKVDRVLDPVRGSTLNLKITPTAQIRDPRFGYSINQLTATHYFPLGFKDHCILALKGIFGSITGSQRITIPPPERFYAGSENTLRGYKYMTVSPLDAENKPIGGRSIMVCSLELRLRILQSHGWAFFYEVGNVYSNPFPELGSKQLQSLGVGFRYYTPAGPLRADIAFPLEPRDGIDRAFQVYLSVGQAF